MKYQYSIIKYVPDTVRGEFANVGVLLWSDKEKFLHVSGDALRFIGFFKNFELVLFQGALLQFQGHFEKYPKHLSGLDFLRDAIPDNEFSLQYGQVLAGVTGDLEKEAQHIFEKMVL